MTNLVMNEAMGPAILHRLQEFVQLPDSGYVAGQAVASAISELFGDGRAVVYNDVDVFRRQTNEELDEVGTRFLATKDLEKRAIDTCVYTTQDFNIEYFEVRTKAIQRYRVCSTTRKGLLNEVYCDNLTANPLRFLETFDINAVQACVDLGTKKLIWTPNFEAFTRTRQIDVVTLHTPFHSLLRYLLKREELQGTYGNDARIIEMLGSAYWLDIRNNERRGHGSTLIEGTSLRWSFGAAYRAKLEKVLSQVTSHFNVVTTEIRGYDVTTLVPRFELDKDMCMSGNNLVHALPKFSRAIREKHTGALQARLNYLVAPAEKKMEDAPPQGRRLTTQCWEARGEGYVRGNVTPDELKQLDKVVSVHAITHHLVGLETTGEQWALYLLIRAEVRLRGLWVYGVLEQEAHRKNWTKESMASYLDAEELRMRETLCTALLPPLLIQGYAVQELVTGMELMKEGTEMHHCVGGYSQQVSSGRSRIFSLRRGAAVEAGSTLKLGKIGRTWVVFEHRGLQNRPVALTEKQLAETFCNYANLASGVGRFLAMRFIQHNPAAASQLGHWLVKSARFTPFSTALSSLKLRSAKLAASFNLPSYQVGRKGRHYSSFSHPFSYWGAYAVGGDSRRSTLSELNEFSDDCPF
jgi:hypothetical protein